MVAVAVVVIVVGTVVVVGMAVVVAAVVVVVSVIVGDVQGLYPEGTGSEQPGSSQ